VHHGVIYAGAGVGGAVAAGELVKLTELEDWLN
jgi:hypothetical protein